MLLKRKNIYFLLLIIGLLGSARDVRSQNSFSTIPERKGTREGNTRYEKGSFPDAEAEYKKVLDRKNNMPEAIYNLGDAQYKQKRFEDAGKQFQLSAQTNTNPAVKAKAFYNLGNVSLENKKWEDAIKAYKQSLKIDPKDQDAKYNLAYANAMLQKQNQGGGDKDQKDKKDQQKKDDQKKDQQKDKKDEQQQQADNNKDKEQQKEPKPGQQPKLSKEDAEKLLQALMNEEQKTNQKMQQKQMKASNVKVLKDW